MFEENTANVMKTGDFSAFCARFRVRVSCNVKASHVGHVSGRNRAVARNVVLPKCAVVFAVCENEGKRFKITQNARFHI